MIIELGLAAVAGTAIVIYRRNRAVERISTQRRRPSAPRQLPVDAADPDVSAAALAFLLVSREGEASARTLGRLDLGIARVFHLPAEQARKLVRKGQWLALISGPEEEAMPRLLRAAQGARISGGLEALQQVAQEALEHGDAPAQMNFNRRSGWLRSALRKQEAMPAA
ncbi:MAG: hypothetical protein AAFQ51_10225 [Pseudomonadota bacterium]